MKLRQLAARPRHHQHHNCTQLASLCAPALLSPTLLTYQRHESIDVGKQSTAEKESACRKEMKLMKSA